MIGAAEVPSLCYAHVEAALYGEGKEVPAGLFLVGAFTTT